MHTNLRTAPAATRMHEIAAYEQHQSVACGSSPAGSPPPLARARGDTPAAGTDWHGTYAARREKGSPRTAYYSPARIAIGQSKGIKMMA
jgi:hypothetical protein